MSALSLVPFFLSFFLSGGLLAFPGAVLDLLLADFGFTPTLFGVALFVQGSCSFLGTRWFSRASLRADSLHALEGFSLLLPVVGGITVYGLDPLFEAFSWGPVPIAVRLVGYAFIGLGVGGSGILNNAFVLRREAPVRSLNVLNMAFTLGAVTLPVAASILLSNSASASSSHILWRLPLLACLLCYLALAAWCLAIARAERRALPEAPAASPANDPKSSGDGWRTPRPDAAPARAPSDRRILLACAVVLFCYVGSEVCLSIAWTPFLTREAAVPAAAARLASPAFWGGLLATRALFSVWPAPARHLARYLVVFGAGVVLCLVTALLLPDAPATPHAAWYALAFLTGTFIGSSYSFTLALVANAYEGVWSSRAAFTVVQAGVAGAICLPPLLGALVDASSFQGGFLFILATMIVFAGAAFLLLRMQSRGPRQSD